MISIFLPPAMPLRCFSASSAPRMPSWPPAGERAFERGQQADLDACCACAPAREPADDRGRDQRAQNSRILLSLMVYVSFG